MILAVDIGNTKINFALIDKKGRIRKRRLPKSASGIEKIFIVSVVPKTLVKVKRDLRKKFPRAKIFVAGRNIRVPLKCAYNKKEIGQDRLITAFAAKSLYGLPILIIDFGTAVTFDAVSRSGVYMGGLILPGIKMSLESLHEGTALLPRTYLKRTSSFIGKNTASSIRNGMIYGYSAICEGMIALFKKKIDRNIKVVATGGDAPLMSRYAPSLKRINLDLSLKGLYFLAKFKREL